MTSDDEEKVKEPPIMDYLRNLRDRIDSKELKVKVDRIYDLNVKGDASICSV
jgi:hypothetical protein